MMGTDQLMVSAQIKFVRMEILPRDEFLGGRETLYEMWIAIVVGIIPACTVLTVALRSNCGIAVRLQRLRCPV